MTSVKLNGVCFSYPVYEVAGRSLKVSVMRQLVGAKLIAERGGARVQALTDISLDLQDGDRIGLIGHNGSGKSSLLRVIARLAYPQQGTVEVKGRIIPLIERALGIEPDLSGADNIELPLRLLGATTEEVLRAKAEIPEWTGLGSFMQLPVRTYSEGMKVRLIFALCTAVQGDVLLLDEWIGAGDAAFVERAQARLLEYIDRSRILVLASHSMSLISAVCPRVLWIERGEMRMFGPAAEVISAYEAAMHSRAVEAPLPATA